MTQAKKEEILKEIKTKLREIEVRVQLLGDNVEEVCIEEEPVNQNSEVVHEIEVSDTELEIEISDVELEIRIAEHLRWLGVPAHVKGYTYAKDAILLGLKDKDSFSSITNILYPEIAKKNQTTASRVERAIRHGIESAWIKGTLDAKEKIFGDTISEQKGRPTNAQFLYTMVDYITLQLKKEGKRIS